MKRKLLILTALCLAVLACLAFSFTASAEETEPTVSIEKFNLAFEDNTYIKYAVKFTGVADEAITESNIGMLYWKDTADGFVPGTEDFSSKTTGYTEISGEKYYVFKYTNMVVKQLADYVYSVAYLEYDGETYYSAPVKFSALEYCYSKLGKTGTASTNADFRNLLTATLEQGAAAQKYFKYNTDRLANAEYYQIDLVGGKLDDGFTSGLFLATDEVKITAPEINEAGNSFVSWIDEMGFVVSEAREFVVSNTKKNTTYSVIDSSMVAPDREGLEYIVNDDNSSCTVIGLGTYSDTEVYIPEYIDDYKVTAIAEKAFADETALTKIVLPETVKTIGARAFYGCTGITEITIPESVTSIGTQIFYKASNLNTVYYNSSYSSSDNPFMNLSHIKKVVFGGKTVPSYILKDCTAILEVEIKDSVTSIGSYAFYKCTALTSVTIGDIVTSISSYAFEGCTSLENVYYTGDIAGWCNIKFSTSTSTPMYYATNLYIGGELITDITIPDSVTSIGNYAFDGCTPLTSITIPDSVTSIGKETFYNCTSLTSVTIGDSVTSIGSHAFSGCTSLTSITIPDSVTSISYYAFKDCRSLTSVTIPDSVTSIGERTFSGCRSLTSVTIPDSVTSIGSYAFEYCYKLVEVINKSTLDITAGSSGNGYVAYYAKEVHTGESKIVNKDDYFFYTYNRVNYLVGYVGDETELTLPESYNGEKYEIYKRAFSGCTSLTSITIPDSVTSIGERTFSGCTSLTSITIPDSVTSIGSYAFYECTSLTSITIPNSVTSIGEGAFDHCTSLTSITIPNSVTSIGEDAFRGCTSLTSMTIGDSVTSIGGSAFIGCTSLKSITIPNSVTSIGEYAFAYCESLESITIPDSVTSIGEGAFWGCTSLKSIIIPDSVMSIGSYAFEDCTSLTIYCEAPSKPYEWYSDWNYSNRPVVWGYKGN